MSLNSPGERLRQAIEAHKPLPIVGTVNAYCAIMAEKSGHKALYLSGAGVANSSFGFPDLGMTTINDVCEDTRRITNSTNLPLLVDMDTGWGNQFTIGRSVKDLIRAGAAGTHIEDQQDLKRCGHRPNKQLVTCEEMVSRIKSAVDNRIDDSFLIMARTDALANEGIEQALERAQRYIEAGADALFPEAITTLDQYKTFCDAVSVPVLANITEFGKTPLFTQSELHEHGVSMVLYPLSAFRAMNKAALSVYETILSEGSQEKEIAQMQTREELYSFLDYYRYEQQADSQNKKG